MSGCNDVQSMADILKTLCDNLKESNLTKQSLDRITINKEQMKELAQHHINEWNDHCEVESLKSKLKLINEEVSQKKTKVVELVSQLEQDGQTMDGRLESLTSLNGSLEQMLERMKDDEKKLDELNEKAKSLEEYKEIISAFNFYKCITKLIWNYKSESRMCEGFLLQKDDAYPFSINIEQSSPCCVASQLWDLIDGNQRSE